MLYREIIAVCSQIHTKHINTRWPRWILRNVNSCGTYTYRFRLMGWLCTCVACNCVVWHKMKETPYIAVSLHHLFISHSQGLRKEFRGWKLTACCLAKCDDNKRTVIARSFTAVSLDCDTAGRCGRGSLCHLCEKIVIICVMIPGNGSAVPVVAIFRVNYSWNDSRSG